LEFPILVTNFEIGSAVVNLTFPSLLAGDVVHDASEGDYGKNYAVTSVISDVYEFEVGEFLRPLEYSPLEFLSEWNRFPVGFVLDVTFDQNSIPNKEILIEKISSYSSSVHQVQQWSYADHYFQLAYSSMTWFDDQLCFSVIGCQPKSGPISARFAFRASDPTVLSIFHLQVDKWFDKLVGFGKYSFSNPEESIFCSTSNNTREPNMEAEPKKEIQEKELTEEEMLQKWQKNRIKRTTSPSVSSSPNPTPTIASSSTPPPSFLNLSTSPKKVVV